MKSLNDELTRFCVFMARYDSHEISGGYEYWAEQWATDENNPLEQSISRK